MIFEVGYNRYYYNDSQLEEVYKKYPETRKSFLTCHEKLRNVISYVDIKTGKIYHTFHYPYIDFREGEISDVVRLPIAMDATKYNEVLVQLYRMLNKEKAKNLLKYFNLFVCGTFTLLLMLPIILKHMPYNFQTSILDTIIYLFLAAVISCLVDFVITWISEMCND